MDSKERKTKTTHSQNGKASASNIITISHGGGNVHKTNIKRPSSNIHFVLHKVIQLGKKDEQKGFMLLVFRR